MTQKEFFKATKFETICDCKRYLRMMLELYADLINLGEEQEAATSMERDIRLWMQTMYSKGDSFLQLLDGSGYQKPGKNGRAVLDTPALLAIVRTMYESMAAFDMLFVVPETQDQREMLYSLFVAWGQTERLRLPTKIRRDVTPQGTDDAEAEIAACRDRITANPAFKKLGSETQEAVLKDFGRWWMYRFDGSRKLEKVTMDDADRVMLMRKTSIMGDYTYLGELIHPSYLCLCQHSDQNKLRMRIDSKIAVHASECAAAFMSIFSVDFMLLSRRARDYFATLDDLHRRAITMYEHALRSRREHMQ